MMSLLSFFDSRHATQSEKFSLVQETTTTIECERIRYKLATSLVVPTTTVSLVGFPLRDSVVYVTRKTFDLQSWFWMYGIRRTMTTTTTTGVMLFCFVCGVQNAKAMTDHGISNGDNKD
jgi:hypothetical protein